MLASLGTCVTGKVGRSFGTVCSRRVAVAIVNDGPAVTDTSGQCMLVVVQQAESSWRGWCYVFRRAQKDDTRTLQRVKWRSGASVIGGVLHVRPE